MSVTLKIVPVPAGTTRDDIAAKIQGDQIDDVEIDETDHIAYVRLRDGGFLEALAAKYGEDLKIADWAARIEILEDDFNWQANRDVVKQKLHDLKEKAAQAALEVKATVENLTEKVAEQSDRAIQHTADKLEELAIDFQNKTESVRQAVS
jgi:ElaB/YqjD/DUF883 family membrane-anchored ribosome-binding protein